MTKQISYRPNSPPGKSWNVEFEEFEEFNLLPTPIGLGEIRGGGNPPDFLETYPPTILHLSYILYIIS